MDFEEYKRQAQESKFYSLVFCFIFMKKKNLDPLAHSLVPSTLSAFVPFKCTYCPKFSDLKLSTCPSPPICI